MQKYFALLLSIICLFPLPIKADGTFWSSFNANILMSQIGVATPSVVLEPMQPAAALYSIEGSNSSVFNPEYLQEAVLGIAFNDFGSISSTSDFSGTGSAGYSSDGAGYGVGGCCYLGGLGGIAGSGASSGGGGGFSYYSASSNYSLGGMGFGGGGGGGNTPPNDTPPPEEPPPPPPPPPRPPPRTPLAPEPETWLTLAGALSLILIIKRRHSSLQGAHGTEKANEKQPKN